MICSSPSIETKNAWVGGRFKHCQAWHGLQSILDMGRRIRVLMQGGPHRLMLLLVLLLLLSSSFPAAAGSSFYARAMRYHHASGSALVDLTYCRQHARAFGLVMGTGGNIGEGISVTHLFPIFPLSTLSKVCVLLR